MDLVAALCRSSNMHMLFFIMSMKPLTWPPLLLPLPESKPSMAHLAQLGIIDTVSSDWWMLGIKLGQSPNDLRDYQTKAMLDNKTCCTLVFDHWMKNGGLPPTYPLSWAGVYAALCAIGHRGTADSMKAKLQSGW